MAAQRLCCLNSSYTMCNTFFGLFPAQECSSDVDFVTAYVFGDPHITTFDQLSYSMNGWGEFTLMSVTTQDFVLQARTGRARTPYGTFVNATVLTAVAASDGNHSHFQAVLDSSGTGMILHVNGQNVTDDFYKKDDFNWTPNNTVSVWRECGQNKTFVLAMFPSGVTVKINTALQNLELEIQATKFLMNKTVGLLGNFNNISEDDLSPTSGFNVSTPIDWRDSKFDQTYIQKWRVNRTHSVFKYRDKEDLSSLQDFRPTFAKDLNLNNSLDICGSRDELCSFDNLVMLDWVFAKNTHNFRSYHSNRDDKLRNNPPTLSLRDKDILVDGRWIVTDGLVEHLELATSDKDGHQVTVSWVDGPPEARRVTNLTLKYVPDVRVPTRIG
ncbi:mucin-like protein [Physella acuta]|uniref:mucin-like protein n=1 Tax=Physella acuta TaxID=109671 RepID=UPI0027DD5336|nr:mucin-like protein [Physella acuta]